MILEDPPGSTTKLVNIKFEIKDEKRGASYSGLCQAGTGASKLQSAKASQFVIFIHTISNVL
jgi:hypothetical protein